ncbi:AAA family ATPase [Intestinimonas sp.]|uniref:AAA family ATPase n=1 Tax=Intestinimonas sp. TaxID=1965293 RepID=UPI00260C3266|nr:AAA family ATPase [Intestinimonas sp.]
MENMTVRLESLDIHNFKNVKFGRLSFENPRKYFASSVLGLYGQNGSGKTAVIDSITLLKLAFSGQPIPSILADYINVDSDAATMRYTLKVSNSKTNSEYHVIYEFSLRKEEDVSQHNADDINASSEHFKATIFDEVLSYTCICENGKTKMLPVIDTKNTEIFGPATKLETLTNDNKAVLTDLLVAKKLTAATSRSYCFSKELLTIIRANCKEDYHLNIIESLVHYGNFELFVINTTNSGLISLNALPLTFRYENNNKAAIGNIALPLNSTATVPENIYQVAERVLADMNVVLEKIIPGLTISIKNLGNQILKDGNIGIKIQLVSHKNSKEIPLQYESEGIKKIISILHLLIIIYNQSSITVAIDELDSGVFEYLLGELLRIISEKGKGQLIFTSHNLRPLETLDRGFIAFTTTNPSNRYIRLANVKSNHNLRDFYYRDIVLGEQSEEVYEPTNNYEIAFAFREAGESSGS